jgi:peptide/nickel transport system ATP-binding protein/oligopeptide transport system ATP-binding protein
MSAPVLSVRNLTVRIRNIVPVQDLSFDVNAGEVLGIVGESGSGKSLTLRAILRLLPRVAQTTGNIVWQGRDLMRLAEPALRALRGGEIAIVFQEPMTALDPVLTIGRQITESLAEHLGLRGRFARARAIELLDMVGIPDARRRLSSYPHEFSGGMRQRAMLAIALAAGPKLLLADEPTTALDVTIQDQILKLLLRLRRELSVSIVLVTHDLGIIAETCDRMAVLYSGRMMETGPVETILERPAHPYTLGLINSVPQARHARQHLAAIPGAPPDPLALPPGCRFAPRCTLASPDCLLGLPELHSVAPDHANACIHHHAVVRQELDFAS